MKDKEVQGYMGEEKRTLTTEYQRLVIKVNTSDGGPMEIPQYAIDVMAEFFLEQMQEEYMREHSTTE